MDVNNFYKLLYELIAEQEQVKIEYEIVKSSEIVSNS
jgi:hypothetical protein